MTTEMLLVEGAKILTNAWKARDPLAAGLNNLQEARHESRLLLSWVTSWPLSSLMAHPERVVAPYQQSLYLDGIRRRAESEPIAYITGLAGFYGREFEVNHAVLIPRPETELLVETVLSWCAGETPATGCLPRRAPQPHHDLPLRVLDVGTGSGCIPISLLCACPKMVATAIDVSQEALDVARRNAVRHKVDSRLELVRMDVLGETPDRVPEKVDVLLSNPPYISTGSLASLMPDVIRHEPVLALDGGMDGLVFYRRILQLAKYWLRSDGLLAVEIGYDQGEAVCELFRQADFAPCCLQDMEKRDRVVAGVIDKKQ